MHRSYLLTRNLPVTHPSAKMIPAPAKNTTRPSSGTGQSTKYAYAMEPQMGPRALPSEPKVVKRPFRVPVE